VARDGVQSGMQKWEYLHYYYFLEVDKTNDAQREWDKFGSQGWELVSVAPVPDPKSIVYIAFFKRPAAAQ
jgi:hypothetical protein